MRTQSSNSLISSSDACRETAEVVVQDGVECAQRFSFYDQIGEVCDDKLTSIQKEREGQCVGFYCIRRNSKLTISLREKTIIHNMLKSCIFHHKKLLFFLVVPSQEENKSTFNVKYKSYICETNGSTLSSTAVKLDIINLGKEDSQNCYKHKSLVVSKKSNPPTKIMSTLQEYTSDKFVSESGSVGLVDHSYSMFYKTLCLMNNLQQELISCNQTIEELKDEIYILEQCNKMDTM